jgi:ABC-type multidrug transport system ATPase subunit
MTDIDRDVRAMTDGSDLKYRGSGKGIADPNNNASSDSHELQVISSSNIADYQVSRTSSARNAIEVRDVDLTYGFGIKTNVVLTGMNLTVPSGGIYALIGPSGCGKTSILRCIMGFCTPDAGSIKVFGKEPGSIGSEVPGKALGYMPQDVALNMNLTVYEMLRYFGKIFLLSDRECDSRIHHLIDVLDIPDKDRFIMNLSGGQQRRVSFACAVIHRPKLAILDEPTVGVDPLIREKIWEFLDSMVKDGSTILLTTHYIEETKKAGMIGFLRKGYLLAEEPPNKIIHELGVEKLEDAFYQLCINEMQRRKKYNKHADIDEEEQKEFFNYPTLMAAFLWLTQGLQQFRRHKKLDKDWFTMLFAISSKFYTQIMRDKVVLFVWLFIPVIILVTTCACIGNLPEVYFV